MAVSSLFCHFCAAGSAGPDVVRGKILRHPDDRRNHTAAETAFYLRALGPFLVASSGRNGTLMERRGTLNLINGEDGVHFGFLFRAFDYRFL